IPAAVEMFDLSERERDWLSQLVQGRAIWKVGARTAVVQTVLTANERKLFDTDSAMSSNPGGFSGTDGVSSVNARVDVR
ncbi:MAG: hypothetical protein KBF94_14030, partial [Ilumatobacteraceae bacterium]|nr:hypothetical protein [Ilumatobacteraceae bacterium]